MGITRGKAGTERAREIEALAAQGYRREQIAERLGMKATRVGTLAKRYGLNVHTASSSRHINPERVLTETIDGVEAYVNGLAMLDGVELPELGRERYQELSGATERCIKGLQTLNKRMKGMYGRHDTSAA